MITVRLNTTTAFSYLYNQVVAKLDMRIYNMAATLIESIEAEPHLSIPNVYLSESILINTAGEYILKIYDDDTLLSSEKISVDIETTPTALPNRAFKLIRTSTQVGSTSATVKYTILNSDGDILYQDRITSFSSSLSSYQSNNEFLLTGTYFVVWYVNDVLSAVERITVANPRTKEVVEFAVGNVVEQESIAHSNTVVLASTLEGIPIEQTLTDSDGNCTLNLYPDDYVITLQKNGTVFTTNNFKVIVEDSATTTFTNQFRLITDSFAPTFSDPLALPDRCLVIGDIYDFSGSPIPFTEVLVSYRSGSSVYGPVFGQAKVYKSDANGHVEFYLLKGVTVEITIMSTSLRRILTIPTDENTLNLMTAISNTSDTYDVTIVNVPILARTSL